MGTRHSRTPISGFLLFAARGWASVSPALLLLAVLLALMLHAPAAARADGGTPTPAPRAQGMTPPTNWIEPPPDGPSQAEHGAFVYWMHCMVCHGDQGQGLAKFRFSYPPQEQNCSAHGCHNDPRAGAGFTFPDAPPVIGAGTLTRFQTAQDLYNFISTRMPYQVPGVLPAGDDWAVTAYLLEKRQVNVSDLGPQNASAVRVNPGSYFSVLWLAGGAAALALIAGLLIWFRRRSSRF
ncbi:MAG: hypothetical protein ACM3JD_10070 [Rudaea sp.]